MSTEKNVSLTPYDISVINAALSSRMRVEIIATDKGIKIYNVQRREMNK